MQPGAPGKYRLERRLGGGGMAEVFEGSSLGAEGFSRRVAIKRMLPGISGTARLARMFIAEAQISAQLVHPNIVSVLDFDRDTEGRLFLVMELVDGVDLDALNATSGSAGPLPVPVVLFVIAEVLRGLGFAHHPTRAGMRGVVHRDVSPHNVLLSWEGMVKVSDFGIAKVRAASAATASAFIRGKPAYMSPEQANGQRLDGRSDLFAVGIMLWEMLCGRRLFVAEDTRATLAAVLFGQIPRPRALRPELGRDLERVVMKLLERDLAARHATAEQALAELMACEDAPRDGRAALTAVLAERFPAAAPAWQGRGPERPGEGGAGSASIVICDASDGASSDAATPASRPLPGPRTVTDAASAPDASPGLGTVMSATTGTLRRRRPGGPAQALVFLAAILASGAATFAIASAVLTRHDAAAGPAPIAPPVPAAPGGAQVPDKADRAEPRGDAPARAAIPDTTEGGEAPKPRAIPPRSTHADATRPAGRLYVVAMPILTITVNGTPYGESPRTITLPVGRHRVRLVNRENQIDELLPDVLIRENAMTTIDRMPR